MIYQSLVIAGLLLSSFPSIPVLAQEIRQEAVEFAPGTTSTTIQGQIQGDETIDYTLRAQAGQLIKVTLTTDNLQNYFNLMPSGDETAIFIGSTSGNNFEGTLPQDGDYTIRVYLMRPAARAEEVANYSLEVEIVDAQADSSNSTTAPYTTDDYDATGVLPCELKNPTENTPVTHSQECPAGVSRAEPGFASIRIMSPDGAERVLNFEADNVTTPGEGELTWGKEGDSWYIGIDNREFYLVPEAFISGG